MYINNKKGFTLIELMAVIAIIGILAVVTLPLYNHYIEKSKLHSALPAIGTYKNDVAMCFMWNDKMDDCNDGQEEVHPGDFKDDYILDITIVSGNILLTVDAENHFSNIYPVKVMFSPRNPNPASATLNWNVYCNDYDAVGETHLYNECQGTIAGGDYDGEGTIDLGNNGSAILNIELLSNITAGYDNSFGYYYADSNGEPSTGFLLFNSTKNQLNSDTTFFVSTNNNENIGLFLIPDGGNLNNYNNGDQLFFFDYSNNGYMDAFFNGSLVDTADGNILFSDSNLNFNGIDTEFNNSIPGNSNWEDVIGGDDDNDDLNLQINIL